MSDFALWLVGTETVVILSLIGILWKVQQKRLKSIEDTVNAIARQTDFAAFQAMDKERLEGWTNWRQQVMHTLDNYEERLRSHTAAIARIEGRMNGVHK